MLDGKPSDFIFRHAAGVCGNGLAVPDVRGHLHCIFALIFHILAQHFGSVLRAQIIRHVKMMGGFCCSVPPEPLVSDSVARFSPNRVLVWVSLSR